MQKAEKEVGDYFFHVQKLSGGNFRMHIKDCRWITLSRGELNALKNALVHVLE